MAKQRPSHESFVKTPVRIPTPEHEALVTAIRHCDLTVVSGSAGTGKTFLSLATALELLEEKECDQIYVIRRVTPTFQEDLGALPGELLDKFAPFAGGTLDNLSQLIGRALLMQYLAEGTLQFLPVSWTRGRTFVRSFVLLDEAQQLSPEMVLCVLTRFGRGSKMVVAGDPHQADHGSLGGLQFARYIAEGLKNAAYIELSTQHIEATPSSAKSSTALKAGCLIEKLGLETPPFRAALFASNIEPPRTKS